MDLYRHRLAFLPSGFGGLRATVQKFAACSAPALIAAERRRRALSGSREPPRQSIGSVQDQSYR